MQLYLGKKKLRIGDRIETFRGEEGKLVKIEYPKKPDSEGRVYVRLGEITKRYCPSHINAFWKN